MKKIFTFLASVFLTISVFAQSPEKMSYQAVIRDNAGNLITETEIGMQISVLQGSSDGTAVYMEKQTSVTNTKGLVSIEIGTGTIESGDFTTIDWAHGPYFIKTETAIESPFTAYTITGTSQLLSVPYALHAKIAETVTETQTLADVLVLSNDGNANQIKNIADPTDSQDAVTKAYIDLLEEKVNALLAYYVSFENVPLVATKELTEITSTTASGGGNVLSNGGSDITERGVVWHITESPSLVNNIGFTSDGLNLDEFVSELVDLTAESTYFVRAYATNSSGTAYGNQIMFETTKAIDNITYSLSLTASPTEAGTITGSDIHEAGQEIDLYAIANEGYHFVNWTRNEEVISEIATFTYTMLAENVTLVANFEENAEGPDDSNVIYGAGVTDIDGNEYNSVIIGDQEWMAENLRVSKYNNGDPILTGLDGSAWYNTTEGAYAIYPHGAIDGLNSDSEVVNAYGKLYISWAQIDSRGLCPVGWRVATYADWLELLDYLATQGYLNESGNSVGAGNALKSCRQMDSPLEGGCTTSVHPRWNSDHLNIHSGFDEFGFNAIPGGFRLNFNGIYSRLGEFALYYAYENSKSYFVRFESSTGHINFTATGGGNGSSVRCLKE